MINIMNKVAICFSGQPRFIEDGFLTFAKNLVGFEDMDVFIHTWHNSPPGNNGHLTNVEDEHNIFNFYNPKNHIVEEQRFDIAPQGVGHQIFIHYSMFYSIWKANELKKEYEEKNNFKYDCVIRTRFDLALLQKFDVTQFDLRNINSPDVCANSDVISDWFNFSNSENMDIYLNAYNNLNDYQRVLNKKQKVSGEAILTHHYKVNNLTIKKIPCNLNLIRTEMKLNVPFWILINDLRSMK